ncbi:MAG: acyltransferase family protein [Oscillospiraceae bacterium]
METLQLDKPELIVELKFNLKAERKPRIVYLDILRVLSIISVITIHTVAGKVADINALGEPSWWWANVLNCMTRWAVPVFFMISGVLTLDSPQLDNIPRFIKSRFLKIGIPFFIWSVIYTLVMEIYILGKGISFPEILGIICTNILFDRSYYHLWFVYDIFIIYLISPLLKKIVINSTKKELEYWLGLWFIATILYSSIQQLLMFIGLNGYTYIHILNIPFVFGLTGYYILGYYLHHYNLPKKLRMVIYIGAAISVFFAIFGTYTLSVSKNILNESLYSHFALTTAIISMAIFIAIKNINWEKFLAESFQKLLGTLSDATFGIYLIHMMLIINFSGRLSFLLSKSYALYTISIIIISFVLSFIFVKLIQLIPYVGKNIV